MSPPTCLIKSGAAHDPPSLGSLAILDPVRAENFARTWLLAADCPPWLSAYRVQVVGRRNPASRTMASAEMRLSGSDYRADRVRHVLAMHAILRFTRYIADLKLRTHHSGLNNQLRFRLSASLVVFFSANGLRVEAGERALMWLALRLPDIGSVGGT
ncbi:hypothetical protein Q7P35_005642 [Cladosporium inversicolor]